MSIYDSDFFQMLEKFRNDYNVLADWISSNIEFQTCIDFGCGSGFIVERLYTKHDKNVFGYDVSEQGVNICNDRLNEERCFVKDLTKVVHSKDADLSISTEVAEHIEEKFSSMLVNNILSPNPRTVLFTAAVPDQRGKNHINCQPHSFWINKFENRNYTLYPELVRKFQADLRPKIEYSSWVINNMMIFKYEG